MTSTLVNPTVHAIEEAQEGRPREYIERFLQVRDKNNALVPFRFHAVIDDLDRRAGHYYVICKPRQVFVTTYHLAEAFAYCATIPFFQAAIIEHEKEAAERVFQRVHQFHRFLPEGLAPELDASRDDYIRFKAMESSIYIGTAGGRKFGRSETVNFLLLDEFAHYTDAQAEELWTGAPEAVPQGGHLIIASTPNGVGNRFHQEFVRASEGLTKYQAFFYPWFMHEEYTLGTADPESLIRDRVSPLEYSPEEAELVAKGLTEGQIRWRRSKLAEKGKDFWQEYAEDEVSCLDGDSRIGTDRGIVPIRDIEIGSVSDHGIIVAKENRGIKDVFLVRTRRGYEVVATADHRFAVGVECFARADSLLGQVVTLQSPVTASVPYTLKWKGFAGVEHSLVIGEDWGRFLGYYMGDGSFGGDALDLAVDARDTDVVASIQAVAERVWGIEFHSKTKTSTKCTYVRATSRWFEEVLQALGAIRVNDRRGLNDHIRDVKVPEVIWHSPKPVIREFLRYLFEADGWASKEVPRVKFFSKYPEFMLDVQRLLLVFGITSTQKNVTRLLNGKSFPGVELVLGAREACLFFEQIGFVSARKSSGAASHYVKSPMGRPAKFEMADEIVLVEPCGQTETWDIQIEGEPIFSANGLLVHNCFIATTNSVFPVEILYAMLKNLPDPIETRENGQLRLWMRPHPSHRYSLGADPAEGLKGGDPSSATLMDGQTGRTVAALHGQIPIHDFARKLADLGTLFGGALVVMERNNHGHAVLEVLHNLGYPNIYAHQEPSTLTRRPGFPTSQASKTQLVANTKAGLDAGDLTILDKETIREMVEYRTDETEKRYSAAPGGHDDRVISTMLAYHGRITSPWVSVNSAVQRKLQVGYWPAGV